MRIGEVIGTVTLSHPHKSVTGGRFPIVVPLSLDNLCHKSGERVEPIVIYDDLGAGQGCLVGISEGREAAQPFDPEGKPIDAYAAAILDYIDVTDPRRE